jgi:hypothetical protein
MLRKRHRAAAKMHRAVARAMAFLWSDKDTRHPAKMKRIGKLHVVFFSLLASGAFPIHWLQQSQIAEIYLA